MISIARRRIPLSASSGGNGREMIGYDEVVDLNLPSGLLWATCNVGATTETEYGFYYMYGKGANTYYSYDTPYNGSENPLASSADTATQEMGSGWRMPTRSEINELVENTTYSWATINGVNGGKFTSKSNPNAYVFFPAAGYYDSDYDDDDNPLDEDISGYIWSSTPNTRNFAYSYALFVWSGNKGVDQEYVCYGVPVRGVHERV